MRLGKWVYHDPVIVPSSPTGDFWMPPSHEVPAHLISLTVFAALVQPADWERIASMHTILPSLAPNRAN